MTTVSAVLELKKMKEKILKSVLCEMGGGVRGSREVCWPAHLTSVAKIRPMTDAVSNKRWAVPKQCYPRLPSDPQAHKHKCTHAPTHRNTHVCIYIHGMSLNRFRPSFISVESCTYSCRLISNYLSCSK